MITPLGHAARKIVRLAAKVTFEAASNDRNALTGREAGATRYGAFDHAGTRSGATSRQDGLDFVFLFNRWFDDAATDEIQRRLSRVLDGIGSRR